MARFAHPLAPCSVLVAACALSSLATGCATMGFSSDKDQLVKTASFDHDCPREKVKVLAEQEEGIGVASFKLDVCGKEKRYKRMGTSFFDAEKGGPTAR
jgi:hypothetical protein